MSTINTTNTITTPDSALRQLLAAMPKLDLHRHLEGAIRLNTMVEIAKEHQLDLPVNSEDDLRPLVQMIAGMPYSATTFLSKFNVIRHFFQSQAVIERITREAVADAAADNVRYLELRFTPKALSLRMNHTFSDVTRWVCTAAQQAALQHAVTVKLIVSMNRHESVEDAEMAVQAAFDHRHLGVVAIDLAGREAGIPAHPFFGLFKQARRGGLDITVHAGEWAGPQNVREAVSKMGATRIGHGVRVVEDNRVVRYALQHKTAFEVCPTSNIQSGAVPTVLSHPLRDMCQIGLNVTLNTDDPGVSNITLTDELMLAVKTLGVSVEDVKRMQRNAVECAFVAEHERQALRMFFAAALVPLEQR